ncbi:Hypp2397 [Branchiostoma lanceolatum]|uniref:Hypp2397 protein n=1 Tax=Branchiostoma lanceolatum TaxID=7740 RepID=A0A8K0ESA7_BRALA|nr:Hypp2397 [Branchiostoma lanceolatum]
MEDERRRNRVGAFGSVPPGTPEYTHTAANNNKRTPTEAVPMYLMYSGPRHPDATRRSLRSSGRAELLTHAAAARSYRPAGRVYPD